MFRKIYLLILRKNCLSNREKPTDSGTIVFTSKLLEIRDVNFTQILRSLAEFIQTVTGHGLLYKWTELLYLTCPHEADLLTLIMSQKPTQYL